MTKKADYTPFTSCNNGHDLTAPSAFLYDSSGRRNCRECAVEQSKSRKSRGAKSRHSFV